MKQRFFYEDSFCISEETSLKNETEVFEHSLKMKPLEDSFCVSAATSLKNETEVFEDSFCVSAATSLKNETEVTIVFVSLRQPR
jgi:hypothetical protein